jgi:cytochrome b-561
MYKGMMAGSNEDPFGVQPARWFLGPPAPRGTGFLARACSLAILVLVGHWVRVPLGGVGLKPTGTESDNDTSKLFNWHPVVR